MGKKRWKILEHEDDKEWHSERPKTKDCVYHQKDEEKPVITFKPQAILKVLEMVQSNPDTEFMVYFFGNAEQRIVEDVYVPKQDVSGGGVHMTEDIEFPGIIGVLHKHPGNGSPRFSGTDENCLNNNHKMSVVIPQNGLPENWYGIVRFLPPCGCERINEAKLVFEFAPETAAQSKEKVSSSYAGDGWRGKGMGAPPWGGKGKKDADWQDEELQSMWGGS